MLIKFTYILLFGLVSCGISLALYPFYITFLQKIKAGQQIREASMTWEKSEIFAKLHAHKAWTPTMWWGLFLIVTVAMIWISLWAQYFDIVNYSLINRQETYILLFAFFSMGILWFVDDVFNIIWKKAIKWLSARLKMTWMFLFSALVCYWFLVKLDMVNIYFWPFPYISTIGVLFSICMFFFSIAIVNAINIADWLDWLVWWLSIMVLGSLWVVTFMTQRYIATTLIVVVIWILIAFLRYNINPAKIFMGDSWALAIWGLIATLVYLLNMRLGIVIPFMVLFLLFWLESLWEKMNSRTYDSNEILAYSSNLMCHISCDVLLSVSMILKKKTNYNYLVCQYIEVLYMHR